MTTYPKCPKDRSDCAFAEAGATTTLLHSPIGYDRNGNPVSGGWNSTSRDIQCLTCGVKWRSTQREPEEAQGKEREWKEIK